MKKKNIEKVFQEKLKDFNQLPEEHVWENISRSLDERKANRRIIPLWWRIGGVAALLALTLFILLPGEDPEAANEIITNVENNVQDESTSEPNGNEKFKLENESVISPIEETENIQKEDNMLSSKDTKEYNPVSKGDSSADIVASTQTLAADGTKETEIDNTEDVEEGNTKAFVGDPRVSDIAGNIPALDEEPKIINPIAENYSGDLADHEKLPAKDDKTDSEETEKNDKPSILEAIAKQEEEITEEKSSDKWEVGPRVAPVFFSSLTQGSPIHSSFNDNTKSGNVNLSYGLAVTYELGKRLKIRSGLHKVDFGYDTQDVSFSSSLNANTNGVIDNIDYSLSGRNLVVRSNKSSIIPASESAMDVAGPAPSLNGKMIQEFGYLEVPLELTYEILDRKIGINLVGGVSSLFLMNNSVTLEADGITTEMGEANNINNLNFSTNFGIGVFYRLNDKIQLNVEPMFKYQLNTFSESSGNFQPFSMGVYSGLNFRF